MKRTLYLVVEIGATLLVVGAVWLVTSRSGSVYVPPLPAVAERFQEVWLFDRFSSDLVPSIARLAIGYFAAAVLGVAAGVLIGHSRVLGFLLDPLITFLRSVPPPTLLPLFLALMGSGDITRILLIAFVCIWPILLNTVDGMRELDRTMLATVRMFRIDGVTRLRFAVLPALMPRIFAGMRMSLAIGLVIMIVSEMFAARNGIGYVVIESQSTFQITTMWAGIVLLGGLGYVLNAALSEVERRRLRWYLARTA